MGVQSKLDEKSIKKGAKRGRPCKVTQECLAEIEARVSAGEAKSSIALCLGISRDTLHRCLKHMRGNQAGIDVSALTDDPLGLVRKYAIIQYQKVVKHRLHLELDDVVSILSEVFTDCLYKYDPTRGAATFETYFRKASENRIINESKRIARERRVIPFNFYHDDDGLPTFD